MELFFVKMHGLGNDFIIVDMPPPSMIAAIKAHAGWLADRRHGVGCDQILITTKDDQADAGLIILNSDGSMAEACGNGTRCVAALMMQRLGKDHITLNSAGGMLKAWQAENGLISVNMGQPRFDWMDIPLAQPADTSRLDLTPALNKEMDLDTELPPAMAINIGNPHCIFAVADADRIPLAEIGPRLETHAIFPEKANIEFISLIGENRIRMRVWERGAGITSACGSGATASAIAAHRLGLTDKKVTVVLDGGNLMINWTDDGAIMTGTATKVFQGQMILPSSDPHADDQAGELDD
ncbi:MAG: diaminopimelate epimerase [Candidatus Puniceispirillales bacterium]